MLGRTLSHYKVVEKIGKGGMGKVYRAKDLELQRDVAINLGTPLGISGATLT